MRIRWTIRVTTAGRTLENTVTGDNTRACAEATRWRSLTRADYAVVRPADPAHMGATGDWQQVYPQVEGPRLSWNLPNT